MSRDPFASIAVEANCTLAAQTAHEIGDLELDAFINKVAHAIAGCVVGAANAGNSGGCAAGAIGAAIGEMTAEAIGRRDDTVAVASLMAGIAAAIAGGDAAQVNLAAAAGGNAAANNYLSHSPFANVKTLVAKENARLTAACEPNCTAEDFRRIDQQAAAVERAADLVEVAKRSAITPDQAAQLAQTLMEIAPFYGTAESALQLITGQSSLTGEEANRIWAAVGLVPLAGGMVRKVGEPVVETLTSALRALEGPVFKTTKEATLTAAELAATQAALTQKAADARALLPSNIRNSGNMGVAEIDVPGVQSSMAASIRVQTPSPAQQASGYVGQVPETFPSSVVPLADGYPALRNTDSEAMILNNIASQLGTNTSAAGVIKLFTERPPCASCANVIQQFQEKYPNIKINIFDNGGKNVAPTRKDF